MYKLSTYNCIIPYKDKYLYYNSLKHSSFVMSHVEHKKMQPLFADPISFDLEYPSVFKRFYEWGFFVDEYVDELATFRYLYSRDIVFNRDYHLVIVSTEEHELSPPFIGAIKKHLAKVLSEKEVKQVCIEWRGKHILDYFDACIHPLTKYAKRMCADAGVRLRNQVEVEISNNAVIHNKLYHKKSMPTYKKTLDSLRDIGYQHPDYTLRIVVAAEPNDVNAMEEFYGSFSGMARQHINLVWKPYQEKAEQDEKSEIKERLKNINNSKELNGNLWHSLLAPRIYQVVLYANKNAYMDIPHNPNVSEPHGILSGDDGSIQWNDRMRENILGNPSFENDKCRNCKHLPLFVGVCSRVKTPIGLVCPIDNKLILPDDVIVKEFESKQQ
jgi:uncharacterized protein